jgi:hypothetical protein
VESKEDNLKSVFSITATELDEAYALADNVGKIFSMHMRSHQAQAAQGGQATNAGQATHQAGKQPAPRGLPTAPAPLSAANLEKQTQMMNSKAAHNRSNSQAGQPPAAPTVPQPPFPLGARKSPTGQPSYPTPTEVTQESLRLPVHRNKKARTSPQISAPSPELKRQPVAETKPVPKQYPCPDPDCEMHTTGFSSEELRNAHVQEEHMKPKQDPFKFVQESLAHALGLDLDAEGNVKASPKADGLPSESVPLVSVASKQGQTPNSKPDLAGTPMSRDLSMRRQGSTAATPGKGSTYIKSENTPKLVDSKLPVATPMVELPQAPAPIDDPWAGSTIDPQSLFGNLASTVGAGIISDLSLYRSLTPNDTPESSKDSGASEPNSDISEGVNLDIDLSWQPTDTELLNDMGRFTMDGQFTMEGLESLDADMLGADSSFQFPNWGEPPSEFPKQLQLDPSLYSIDTF